LLADGESQAAALTGGFRLVFGISAGLLLAGILLSATLLRPATARHADQASDHEVAA
jgi:hypothetical protein